MGSASIVYASGTTNNVEVKIIRTITNNNVAKTDGGLFYLGGPANNKIIIDSS
jgi:hypothetical protein